MARIRTIKPEFWTSESIGRLPRDARLLFIALWNLADDSGRIRGSLAYLSGAAFPYDDDARSLIGEWLDQLARAGMVRKYTGPDGNSYIDIPNWLRHQKIDKPSPSRIPSFDECSSNARRTVDEGSALDLGSGNGNGSGPGSNARPPPTAPPTPSHDGESNASPMHRPAADHARPGPIGGGDGLFDGSEELGPQIDRVRPMTRSMCLPDLRSIYPALLVFDADRATADASIALYGGDAWAGALAHLSKIAAKRPAGKHRVLLSEVQEHLQRTVILSTADFARAGLPPPPGTLTQRELDALTDEQLKERLHGPHR